MKSISIFIKFPIFFVVLILSNYCLAAKVVNLTPANFASTWGTIQPGDKVIFSAGDYRAELLLLANKKWSIETPTTFSAVRPGVVFIKGSDIVSDWKNIGGSRYVRDWNGVEPEQVFVGGVPLAQLGGTIFAGFPNDPKSIYNGMHASTGGIWPGRIAYVAGTAMPAESFFYNAAEKKIYLNTLKNVATQKVEVSVRRRPFYAEGVNGITLDGLIIEHSNTSYYGRGAALTIIGSDNIIQNVTVRNTDLTGIQTVGDRNKVRNSILAYNGQAGLIMRGTANEVTGVNASFNNSRKFNKWWEAGGFKFVGNGGLQASRVSGNYVVGNQGDGIWFDWNNKGNFITENVVAYNAGFGIHYEASKEAAIMDNYVYGNGQRGVFLADSANSTISHNMVIANNLEGVAAVYTGRRDDDGKEFGGGSNKVDSNIIGWNGGTATLIMSMPAPSGGGSDVNVFLGTPKAVRFSIGYPTSLKPAVSSLSSWIQISGMDAMSVAAEVAMPTALANSLARRSTDIDWSEVRGMAANLRKNLQPAPTVANSLMGSSVTTLKSIPNMELPTTSTIDAAGPRVNK